MPNKPGGRDMTILLLLLVVAYCAGVGKLQTRTDRIPEFRNPFWLGALVATIAVAVVV